ncbi:lantibiotic dehydratase [Streptomyces sp. WMMB 322]|uniref:lantibiotic dehydratase n=1 Tax=Streptomyces sp. WMMB 322 TaxID=1286821 RepID=UPI0006E3D282|nr:lantibiotic dehydratase [Streptomyces sp. WMMB 322]SCK48469.1 thiopeptide-type bacteriocin biosynthesis domain-containing protein [Streptomyces sp. WMMB 322]
MGQPSLERPFESKDVFLLRAPLAPESRGLPLPHGPGGGPGDLSACADLLASVTCDSALSEALDLASPSLSATIRRVAELGAGAVKAGQLRRAALAVLRYDIRMRTRPTPFGLFAGVATGHFDSAAKVGRGAGHRTRTHADMQWLTRIVHRLESDPAVLAELTVQAHQGLVQRGDRLVLTSPSTQGVRPGESGEGRSVVSVRRTPVVERAVAESPAPVPYEELVRLTAAAFPGAPAERVRALLAELVRQEILITGLRPPLDGGDPLSHVLGVLARVGHPSEATCTVHEALLAVEKERQAYDECPVGEGREPLGRLLAAARSVEPDDTPLHIDTRLDAEMHLPYPVREVIEEATGVMWRLSRSKLGLFALRDHHRRFLDVYGADRLVPVLELLDEATGIGAPAGYGWPNSEAAPVTPEVPRTARRDRAMARLVAAAQRQGAREVVLEDGDIDELCHDAADPADLPSSCEVTVQVVAPSVEALDDGDFRVFLSPSPGSHRAGSTFARFADQHPYWREQFAALHRGNPVHVRDAHPVDLAFMPRSGRAANLAHTVPATGRRIGVGLPDAAGTEELRLSDMGIGATLDRLTAVHIPTGREIVPVLGNMVSAPAQAPNAVRLLWEIGLEGQRLWEPWNWGPLADAPFVPRVRYGRFVLACAVWRPDVLRAGAEELRGRREAKGGSGSGSADAERDALVAEWRSTWDVPRHVLAVTADQRLLLDLDLSWHRELLVDQVIRHPDLVAQEVPGEYENWMEGPLAGHTTELVIPLVRRGSSCGRRPYAGHIQPARTTHGLGSEWLYLKLHGPARTQDDVLRDRIPELVGLAGERGADGWFFIRYTDEGGHHLRLRLHSARPAELWGDVAPAVGELLGRWQREGILRGHSLAQYDPETERYGGPGAQLLAERVFRYDSEAAVELLRLAKDPSSEYGIDDLAVVSCAALAHAFGPPAPDNPLVTEDCGDDGAAAWLSMTGSRRDLPAAFRAGSARWRRLVDPYGGWPALSQEGAGSRALDALRPRDDAVRELAALVRESGETPEGRVVGSLLHMVCNRLFGGESARELKVLGIARGAVQDHLNRRRHQS